MSTALYVVTLWLVFNVGFLAGALYAGWINMRRRAR